MSFNHSNETPEQRKKRVEADMAARQAARERNKNIRCYGGQGFTSREIQKDGTVKERYHYGRDGD